MIQKSDKAVLSLSGSMRFSLALVLALGVTIGASPFVHQADASVSGNKLMDNDPSNGTATNDSNAFNLVQNDANAYSNDYRIAYTPNIHYKYHWNYLTSVSSPSTFRFAVYLANNAFTNPNAGYYVNGQLYCFLNQDTALNQWNTLAPASGRDWVLSQVSEFAVDSYDGSSAFGQTGADATKIAWF